MKKEEPKVHITAFAIALIVLFMGNMLSGFPKEQNLFYISTFGLIALLLVILTLALPIFENFRKNKLTESLMDNRKWIGIYAFLYALVHVVLVYHFFYSWNLSKTFGNSYIIMGFIAFLILLAMTLTSKRKYKDSMSKENWKKLHNLIYIALILIVIHALKIGKIFLKSQTMQVTIVLISLLLILNKIRHSK